LLESIKVDEKIAENMTKEQKLIYLREKNKAYKYFLLNNKEFVYLVEK